VLPRRVNPSPDRSVGLTALTGRAERTGGTPNCSANTLRRAPDSMVGRHETACAGAIGNAARGKAMDRIIEEERGTYTPRSVHPHNGYYAGDFSSIPFKQPELHRVVWSQHGEVSVVRHSVTA
jgi:hypothetical protein